MVRDDVKFSDLFDPLQPRSDKDLIESRLEICNTCEWFNKRMVKCKKCGCFMKLEDTEKQISQSQPTLVFMFGNIYEKLKSNNVIS